MTFIRPIWRYSLEEDSIIKDNLDNKSFSIVKKIITNDEKNLRFDYIMIINGNRAVDISNDGLHPYSRANLAERIGNYYSKKKNNVIIEQILLDNEAPLIVEARMIANRVDTLSRSGRINTVNLIGHSKGGTILFNAAKFFKSVSAFKKTGIITSASPFKGCLIASPSFFLKKVQKAIYAHLPEPISRYAYEALTNFYNSEYTYSHMDNDIALPGYASDKYDPDYIAGMFSQDNIAAINRLEYYHNITTGIDEGTLFDSLRRRDFAGVGMYLIDKYFMDERTDGFIETSSQESVKEFIDVKATHLKSRTHCYLYHDDDLGIVLDKVSDRIDEHNDKCLKMTRKISIGKR